MKTSIMFINESQPLSGVPVRLSGDVENVYVTDIEGKIKIDLIQGTHVFEIQMNGAWLTREVSRKGDSQLFVVDIGKPDSSALSTLNTLQIDLSQMVGDRYVFETILGRGGMGVVVKAIDRLLNRPVAIKMLTEELQDNDEAQQIFLVEARNLATLSHPNLVAIHDILNIEGRVLMVFEYVLGENLETMIKNQGAIGQVDALRTAIQLTRCVAYLHDHELIHRDLKPSNIIMQSDGTLKLIDFGLARSLNELYIRGTRVRGTPAYMAPEQVMGIHLTIHTDLYQIGITLFEMLAGSLPFASGDLAYAHVHKEVPSLLECTPTLSPDFAALVHQLLEKQPKDRPSSAHEVLERLSAIYARMTNEDYLVGLNEPSFSTGQFSAVSTASVEQHFDSFEEDIEIIMPFDDPEVSVVTMPVVQAKKEIPVAAIAAVVAVLAIIGVILIQFVGLDIPTKPSPAVVASPIKAKAKVEPIARPVPQPKPIERVEPKVVPELPEPSVEVVEVKPVDESAKITSKPIARPKLVRTRPKVTAKTKTKTKPKPEPVVEELKPEPAAVLADPIVKTMKIKKKPTGLLSVDVEQDDATKPQKALLPVN